MKLLLTGANGQVGRELGRVLAPLGEVMASTRDGRSNTHAADLAKPETLPAWLDRLQPTVIVNTAAWTAVDRAENEPRRAHRVNADAVDVMARWCRAHAALMVHYSSDYVFGGHAARPWREDDATAPLGVYGASKRAGEQALRASGAPHLIFRTAWVYSAHGHNFLRTMLRLAGERTGLDVVDDQHGTPTPAGLIAQVTVSALARWQAGDAATRSRLGGTWHLTASGETTWCGFARAIMQRATAAGFIERPPEITAVHSAAYPTAAARPKWSVLDTGALREALGIRLPPWQQGLDGVIAELAAAQRH